MRGEPIWSAGAWPPPSAARSPGRRSARRSAPSRTRTPARGTRLRRIVAGPSEESHRYFREGIEERSEVLLLRDNLERGAVAEIVQDAHEVAADGHTGNNGKRPETPTQSTSNLSCRIDPPALAPSRDPEPTSRAGWRLGQWETYPGRAGGRI